MKRRTRPASGLPFNFMLEKSKVIMAGFKANIADFTTFDPDMNLAFVTGIEAAIEEVEMLPSDRLMRSRLVQLTRGIWGEMKQSYTVVKHVRYFIDKAFPGDDDILHEFGFHDLSKMRRSQKKFIPFMKEFHLVCTKYSVQLNTAGFNEASIAEIKTRAAALDEQNTSQELYKKEKYVTTGKRIKRYDALWGKITMINKAARLIYDNDPDKLSLFAISEPTTGKPSGMGILTGMVTDIKTNKAIEDAIVELDGTEINSTTDENGEFYIDEVPVATYKLTATKDGYVSLTLENIVIVADQETDCVAKMTEEESS